MRAPLERFLIQALKEFERHLGKELTERGVREHMRGARQFAAFLVGRPHRKGRKTDLEKPLTGVLPFREL